MATCSECGAPMQGAGPCSQCGREGEARAQEPQAPEALEEEPTGGVHIDPERLQVAAPRPDQAPAPGAWGPAQGPAPPAKPRMASVTAIGARRAARIRNSEPTPEPEPVRQEPDPEEKAPAATKHPPPRLASSALKRELAPATPSSRAVRLLAVVLGVIGASAALGLLDLNGLAIPAAGTFMVIALVGMTPMPYAARATALTLLSGGMLVVSTYRRIAAWDALDAIVLTVAVTLLGTALLFRAWHRGSLVARLLVAVGVVACGGWLSMVGALEGLTTLPGAWQGWAPRVLQVPFALLLMLSLLAFMDARSTGGCGGWAGLLFAWFCGYVGVGLLARLWPEGQPGPALAQVGAELTLATVVSPLLTILLCYGLAQLLAASMAFEEDEPVRADAAGRAGARQSAA